MFDSCRYTRAAGALPDNLLDVYDRVLGDKPLHPQAAEQGVDGDPPILAAPYALLKAFHRLGAVEADCRQQLLQERASVWLCEKSSSGPIQDWFDDQL